MSVASVRSLRRRCQHSSSSLGPGDDSFGGLAGDQIMQLGGWSTLQSTLGRLVLQASQPLARATGPVPQQACDESGAGNVEASAAREAGVRHQRGEVRLKLEKLEHDPFLATGITALQQKVL